MKFLKRLSNPIPYSFRKLPLTVKLSLMFVFGIWAAGMIFETGFTTFFTLIIAGCASLIRLMTFFVEGK